MANTTIQIKKSGAVGNTPVDLTHGELAINYADGKLYYKNYLGSTDFITNQDSFATIVANTTPIIASSTTDILSIEPGHAANIYADGITKSITIGVDESKITDFVRKSGSTMSGNLDLPNSNVHAEYIIVDKVLYSGLATQSATPLPNVIAQFTSNSNSYIQVNAQNINEFGSADFVVTADNGSDTEFFIDMGLNGSQFDNSGSTAEYPLDGYLIVQGSTIDQPGGNLVIGTSSQTTGLNTKIVAGGLNTENIVAEFGQTGVQIHNDLNVSGVISGQTINQLVSFTQAAFDVANNASANAGTYMAQQAWNTANSSYVLAGVGYNKANAAFDKANSSFDKANSSYAFTQVVYDSTNVAFSQANSSFDKANASYVLGQNVYNASNVAFLQANSAFSEANSAYTIGSDAYILATQSNSLAGAAFNKANSASELAQAAFDKANTGGVQSITANSSSRITQNSTTGAVQFDLATSGVSAGSYSYPSLQVDSYGRVTNISNQTPVTSFNGMSGAVTLSSANVISALTYTPVNKTGDTMSGNLTGIPTLGANTISMNGSTITSNTYTTTSNTQVSIDSFSTLDYRTCSYQLSMTYGGDYHTIQITTLQNGASVWMNQFAEMYTNTILGTFDADISGGNVRLLFTPIDSSVIVDFIRTGIVAKTSDLIVGDMMLQSGNIDLLTSSGSQDLMV